MKLFSRIYGDGQPIIIIHGLFGMSDNWNSLGKKMASNYTVHLIDLRNHGRSPHSNEFNYDVMSNDILEYIQHNNIHKPVILGHSLGGKIAMKIAFENIDYIKKLIIVDIAPREYAIDFHLHLLNQISCLDLSSFQKRSDINNTLALSIKEEAIRLFLMKNLYREGDNNRFFWRFNIEVLKKELYNIKNADFLKGNISIETLFLKGGDSDYVTKKDEMIICSHFSNVQINTINETGHWLHAENPELFYNEVIRFISK